MIGRDEKMLIVFEWIRTAAKSDISVLILGPTGSGKEVVARMIHELSRRSEAKFQAVNCAALPDTLFESEIFGYEKGAFTGAHDRKPGRLELANDGTLFLDEIGDMSIVAQAKLLRVLEERRFERLGGNRSISVDFRLISATNRPLDLFVRDGRFREDLFSGSTRSRFACRRCASGRPTFPCLHSASSRATAPPTACRSTPRASRKDAVGPAGGLSLARQHPRARKHRVARGAILARRSHPGGDIEFLQRLGHSARRTERPAALAARSGTRPRPARARSGRARTRRKRPECSTSAAARSTGRSSNTKLEPPKLSRNST